MEEHWYGNLEVLGSSPGPVKFFLPIFQIVYEKILTHCPFCASDTFSTDNVGFSYTKGKENRKISEPFLLIIFFFSRFKSKCLQLLPHGKINHLLGQVPLR